MQDQNILALDIEKSEDKKLKISTPLSFDAALKNDSKHAKVVEKNQKIYSENDSKKFEDILLRHIEKMNEKSITQNQLLTQHKKILTQLFSLGVTTEEVLMFLKENNFRGITAENLTAFSKKKK